MSHGFERVDLMDEIKEIYSGDIFSTFIEYCELHNYKQMRDLVNCRFDDLPKVIKITPRRLRSIKSICYVYFKKHPECFKEAKPQKESPKENVEDLKDRLLVIFQQNANKLIHISDIAKQIGKGVKRSEIISVLERQKWCKIVDSKTFFYSPED